MEVVLSTDAAATLFVSVEFSSAKAVDLFFSFFLMFFSDFFF